MLVTEVSHNLKFMISELAIKLITRFSTKFSNRYLNIFNEFSNTNIGSKKKLLGFVRTLTSYFTYAPDSAAHIRFKVIVFHISVLRDLRIVLIPNYQLLKAQKLRVSSLCCKCGGTSASNSMLGLSDAALCVFKHERPTAPPLA